MQTKVLAIAVIRDGMKVLLRKKPDGSPPYAETWYLFGAELTGTEDPETALRDWVRAQTGIEIRVKEQLSWDTEIKHDLDGEEKFFVYLDVLCEYVSGDLVPAPGIERLAWVPIVDLKQYDLVPPSVKLFTKLGYL